MQNTSYVRKKSTRLKWWSPDYLVVSALQRDLRSFSGNLTGLVLDLGCGNRPYQAWLTNSTGYVGYDVDQASTKPDVVGVSHQLPFAAASFDSVLATQVIEHVKYPWRTLEEIKRVMKPRGSLLLSAPQSWRLHEKPYDFFRYTKYGLESLLIENGFAIRAIKAQGGVWMHIGSSINNSIWHSGAKKGSIGWVARKCATVLLNGTFGCMDRIWMDPDDTDNYVVFAQRVD